MKERPMIDHAACNEASRADIERFEETALNVLRERGFRITMTRIQVIRALAESNRALTAYSIHERISKSGGRIDVVSVYRILSTLQEVGLVHRIGIVDGYYACRASDAEHHNAEHLVCSTCGCVTELMPPKASVDALLAVAKSQGFETSEIRMELLGTCAHCAAL